MTSPKWTASALVTGSVPGWPRQIGQVWVLGSSPKDSAQPEGDRGRGRGHDEVHALEGRPEVVGDLGPHTLRAAVVGLVVAGRQRVGAEHDAALDLGAEPLRPGLLVEREQIAVHGPRAV